MIVVGLTGGIGSGKTTVLKMFKALDVSCYIADVEAKKIMNSSENVRTQLIQNFGTDVFKNNQLNRAYLATIVFKEPKKLAILNSIVHPVVQKHFKAFVKAQKGTYLIYENAILFESKANTVCDLIITVTAPINNRINRVIARDNVTYTQVLDRMNNQLPDSIKIAKSHFVITNLNLEKTQLQVQSTHQAILKYLKKC